LVKSYAYYEDQNVRNREYMEDQGRSVENLGGDPNKMIFCIFDGHGGGEVSKFLQEYFHTYMKQLLPFDDYFKGFLNLFRLLDEKIKSLNVPTMGSTGTVVFIEKIKGKKTIYCANVGDSRCILVNRKGVMRMSYDDRVDDPKENERIISSGGIIVNERVYGTLMLSRSFGDWAIKSYGVIVDPHITKIEVTDDDLCLIIASDGVWDVIKDEECTQFFGNSKNTLDLCKNIVAESLKRGSQDNISCFAISFK
jgi:serine/threonine protein phosphatase PrpC